MNDSRVAMTRLLFDGDGGGDDRRLNLLAKQVLKWTSSSFASDAVDDESAKKITDDDNKQYTSLIASVLNIQWNVQKTKLVQTMAANETKNYDILYDQIKEEIEKAAVAIKATKEELKKAQKIRRNRLEYDAMAKVIKTYPDRHTTTMRLEEVEAELEKLRQEEEALDEKIAERKKQFHLLVHTIHQLQELLNEDGDSSAVTSENQSEEYLESNDAMVVMDVN